MKRLVLLLAGALLMAALLSGCVTVNPAFTFGRGGSAVTGQGTPEVYELPAGEITEIRVELFCNIELYATFSPTVKFEVQPNMMEYIEIVERNGVLTVRATRNINFTNINAPVLTVGTPALTNVTFSGAGIFTAHDVIKGEAFNFTLSGAGRGTATVDVDRVNITLSGAGAFELAGTADTANITVAGAGGIDALSLRTREAGVSLSGVGSVKISCSDRLRINAGGMGSVEYRGSPHVDLNRGGMVTVKQVE